MCRLFLMTIACLAILFGISGLYMMPKLIQRKIEERMQLKIGTKNFDRFTRVPIPLKVKFYFFNVTNGEQVLKGLERPQFQEVGPFMYEQWRRRSIVDIVDNNRKITYKEFKTFYSLWPEGEQALRLPSPINQQANTVTNTPRSSDEKQTTTSNNNEPNPTSADGGGSQEGQPEEGENVMLNPYGHNVTIINLPLLSLLTKLAELEEGSLKRNIATKIVARLIREGQERILITKPVNELLFDGYKVGVMEAARELVSTTLGFNFESPLPRNKFGFFHGKNNTWKRDESGELTIFTGRNESMNDFMMVDNWNGLRELNTWPRNTEAGNRCNQIRGTDGSQFHPGVTRDHVLGIFSPMICTSIQVKYKEDTSCKDIPLLRFITTPQMFAAPKKSPQNACYCTIKEPVNDYYIRLASGTSPSLSSGQFSSSNSLNSQNLSSSNNSPSTTTRPRGITNGRCYIDGLLDLSLCQKGAPVAASPPHFYNGDPMLAMAAGLKPDKKRHETYMDIEPMTGAVMRAASRAQLNALVEAAALEVVDSQLIGHMTPMVAPMLWLEESAEIDEKSSRDFKGQLLNMVNKARRSFIYAIIFGLLLALGVALQYWYVTCYKIDVSAKRSKRALELKSKGSVDMASRGDDDDDTLSSRRRQRSRSPGRRGGRPSARSTSGGGGRNSRRHRNAVGARKSNLAAPSSLTGSKQPLVRLNDDEDDRLRRAGAAAVAVAVALGAADAAATRNQRDRKRRSAETAQQQSETPEDEDQDELEVDEDELSRRNLVDNEWGQHNGRHRRRSNTGESSALASSSISGHEADLQEASTSAGGRSHSPQRPASALSSLYSDD